MSKSGQAYIAEMDRRLTDGETVRAIDPYDHDIAIEALRRIATGNVEAPAIARVALDRIEDRAARRDGGR